MYARDPGGPLTRHPAGHPASDDPEVADVALAQRGDGHAFERLYRSHVARVHSLVRRLIPDADPDELTQDVFVLAWQKLGLFRGEAAFGTWLYRLAVNFGLSRQSDLARRRRWFADDETPLELVPARPAVTEAVMDLEAALDSLPVGSRQVFVLHDVEGYRHEEIAKLLGVTVGTTKSQLHRARMALRRTLRR